MTSDIKTRFQDEATRQAIEYDQDQVMLIGEFERLARDLEHSKQHQTVLRRVKNHLFGAATQPIKGLYVWGGVGRGKTFLMDIFFDAIDIKDKTRRHFHRFMHDVHLELNKLKNEQDPLALVARNMRQHTRLICFDEFFVSDIADAMVLGGLFRELFARGVTLVATSNVPPNELYRNGLQRERFLPAIEEINQNTVVIEMNGQSDYRLRVLEQVEFFHTPVGEASEARLAQYFNEISSEARADRKSPLEINNRIIETRRRSDGVVWFAFDIICGGPRSPSDYIEIARCFHTVIVDGVPQFLAESENEARRFIALVDELYDHNVKLIISAESALSELYQGKRLAFEFQRTESRLIEMQSRDYLGKPHIP